MLSSCFEAALEYSEIGWSVVPIKAGGKSPLIPWAEFQTRRASEEEIRAWWTKWPDAGVGVVTGEISGLVVADVDPRHGGNASRQWQTANTDLIANTGGGGNHLLYKHPGGHVASTVGSSPGVDIRADEALVVLPPSIHASGRPYSWKMRGDPGVWVQPDSPTGPQGAKPRWLTEALGGVGHGQRDDTAARIAGYFVSKDLPPDVTLSILENWNKKNDPPLLESDLERIVESVFKGSARRSATMSPAPSQAVHSPFSVQPFKQFMQEFGQKEVRWAIEGWLPESTMLLAVAPPGSYKTWLLFDLAVSIATGTPFLGQFPVSLTGPVLVIQMEDFLGDVAARLSEIVFHRFGMALDSGTGDEDFQISFPPDIPIYVHTDRMLHFEEPSSLQGLYKLVESIRPALVIVDPLYAAASTESFMAQAAGSMLALKTMRDKFGTSFAIAHHTVKGTADGKTNREQAWGSQFLNAFLETGWQIRRVEDTNNTVSVQPHFKVKSEVPEVILEFDIATEAEHRYSVRVVDGKEIKEAIGSSIAVALTDGRPHTISELSEETGLDEPKIKKILEKMKADGKASNQGRSWTSPKDLPTI